MTLGTDLRRIPQGGKGGEKKLSPLPPSQEEGRGDRRKSQEVPGREGGGRGQEQRSPGEEAGRQGGRKDKSREMVAHELKDFNQKFHLQENQEPTRGPGGPATPTVSVKAAPGQAGPAPLASPGAAPGGHLPPGQEQQTPAPAPSPGPLQSNGPLPSEVKKSSLNPNAKEFSLNANAKEFTPRPARVAPTPPRPQTPNTPQGPLAPQYGPGYMLAGGQGLAMSHVSPNTPMFVPQQLQHPLGPATSQFLPRGAGPPHGGRGAGPGAKEGGGPPQGMARPDLPSPMAVTGHPILAGPGIPGQPPHGQPYFSPHPGQPVYSHQPGQVIRMVTMPGGIPGMVPGMMPVMTSHSGDTPGHHTATPGHGPQQMWAAPSPHAPHMAAPTPPSQSQPPPSATPPQPSPGMYQPHPGQPASLPPQGYPGQPMFVLPAGHAMQGGHMVPTSMAQGGQVHPHLIGPGGQPVTSMGYMINPQFQQHVQHQGQGHLPQHMLQQQQHNQ